jgi:hypothetical protein
VLNAEGGGTAEYQSASTLSWTAEQLTKVQLQPEPEWGETQLCVGCSVSTINPTANPTSGPPIIVVKGMVVLSGVSFANFEGDPGLQDAVRVDIADAAGVQSRRVVLVSASNADQGSRRLLQEAVQVNFEITVASTDGEAVTTLLKANFDLVSTAVYATTNDYGVLSATLMDVGVVSSTPSTPNPTLSPTVGEGEEEGMPVLPIVIGVVGFIVVAGVGVFFLRNKQGKEVKVGKGKEHEMTGVNPGAGPGPLNDAV